MTKFTGIKLVTVKSNIENLIFDNVILSYGEVREVANTEHVKSLVAKKFLSLVGEEITEVISDLNIKDV